MPGGIYPEKGPKKCYQVPDLEQVMKDRKLPDDVTLEYYTRPFEFGPSGPQATATPEDTSLFDHVGQEKNELKEVLANLEIQRDKRVYLEITKIQWAN
ncbi:hypothetical protein GIB67_037309 [Kingdonia uniflora]|uniref:Uncharacterized protein n=1 Tax=Kingdonia uniflora TaxID=39325 RepID=A0A7J7MS78_9MAGN|nr:hypothetical protein GIB67_037309 [Kingdonia uniflora]